MLGVVPVSCPVSLLNCPSRKSRQDGPDLTICNSVLAAKAGAKHVYAIEASGLAVKARENIQKNGFANVITVIQGKVEDIQLPVKEVDVIVSEWMGYMLLYESMLDSVLVYVCCSQMSNAFVRC